MISTQPRFLLALFFIFSVLAGPAQKDKAQQHYPPAFTISKAEYEQLPGKTSGSIIDSKQNKYLNQARVLVNTVNGDMRYIKIQLHYFEKSFLVIQVNGVHSTQVFVLSDDKSVFYKGSFSHGKVTMNKCSEDEIVSE